MCKLDHVENLVTLGWSMVERGRGSRRKREKISPIAAAQVAVVAAAQVAVVAVVVDVVEGQVVQ